MPCTRYGEQTHDVIFGPHVPAGLADPQDCFGKWVDYGIQEDDEYVVIGIPDLNADSSYAGHIANDGSCLTEGTMLIYLYYC